MAIETTTTKKKKKENTKTKKTINNSKAKTSPRKLSLFEFGYFSQKTYRKNKCRCLSEISSLLTHGLGTGRHENLSETVIKFFLHINLMNNRSKNEREKVKINLNLHT